MANLIDGNEYIGIPCNPEYGPNPDNGRPEAKLWMEIVEGDMKGAKVPYKANFKDEKSIKYSKRDMKAAGWQGKTIATFVADISAASQAGKRVQFTARLASNGVKKDGSPNTWWTVGSIGHTSVPLGKPTEDMNRQVDSWFDSSDDDHGNSEPAPF